MSRKRLQNIADVMCQIFCGWRQISSKPRLVELGSGMLEIDAVTGACAFEGKDTEQLRIAEEIRAWLQSELGTNKIGAEFLSAHLYVRLLFSLVPWDEQMRQLFYSSKGAMRTEQMHQCLMECHSEIRAEEVSYTSDLVETQKWPLGWPEVVPTPE